MAWFNDILNDATGWLDQNIGPYTGGVSSDFGTTDTGGSAFDSSTYSGSGSTPDWLSSPNSTTGLDTSGGGSVPSWWNSNTYGDILGDTGSAFSNNDPSGSYAQTGANYDWSWATQPYTDMFGSTGNDLTAFTNGPPATPNQSSAGAPITSIAPVTPGMAPITGATDPAAATDLSSVDAEKRRQQQTGGGISQFDKAYNDTISGWRPGTSAQAQPTVPGTGPAPKDTGSMKLSVGGLGGGAGLLGSLVSGGLAAYNLSKNNVSGQEYVNNMKNGVAGLDTEGRQLMSYLNSGQLPSSFAQQIANGVQQAKTQAASAMAARGLSADPKQNSALAAQYAEIDRQAIAQQGAIASQMYQQGLSAVGLSQNTYAALQKIYADSDKQTQASIMNFATALGKMAGGKAA